MKIQPLVLGELQTNCYLAICEKTNETVVIDPADEGDFISDKILQLKLVPKFVIATHAHLDHLMAVEEIRLNFQIPFLIHEQEEGPLKKWTRRLKLPPQKWQALRDRAVVQFGREKLQVIHTPGHTPGAICLYSQRQAILFSDDLLFREGVGRADLEFSSPADLEKSLKKILALPPKILVYPGHGEAFILKNGSQI